MTSGVQRLRKGHAGSGSDEVTLDSRGAGQRDAARARTIPAGLIAHPLTRQNPRYQPTSLPQFGHSGERHESGIADAYVGQDGILRFLSTTRKADYQSAARCHLAPHRLSGLA